MRFDDMIATVLTQPSDRPDRRSAQWRQLVDLLAQRSPADSEGAAQAYAFLRAHRSEVEPAVRQQSARALAGLAIDPELIIFFAEDNPAIAAPLITGARLESRDWLAILPRLGPTARALLRHRRDLTAEVKQALGMFGSSDFVLGTTAETQAAEPAPAVRSESQIRELVERIEAYRRRKEGDRRPVGPVEAEPVEGFRWEAGSDGIIRWLDGAPREPLVGQSIAAIAMTGGHGVDGQAAGAFEKRAPFRDARFTVVGEGSASGEWRISGVPFFDPARGSFLGYRGTARRPRLDEIAHAKPPSLFGTKLPADALRQLVHELRTPLNAIVGFAEMIEGQYMGPAAGTYRDRATEIVGQARRLLSAVDDLDTAARIETRGLQLEEGAVDAVALMAGLHESYGRLAAERGSTLTLEAAPGLPLARAEAAATERMFSRLLAATIGLARADETIAARMKAVHRGDRTMLQLSLDRPEAVEGLAEAALLDPGYSPEGDWPGAPALGLGFALRLVRNLAEAVGGSLLIEERKISLLLPALVEAPTKAEQSEGSA